MKFCPAVLAVAFLSTASPLIPQSASQAERLSAVMQRISSEPDFQQQVEQLLGGESKHEFLTSDLLENLRKLILGRDWQRVDHFPSMTIGELNKSVAVTERAAGKSKAGNIAFAPDVGLYSLGKNLLVDLNSPATKPTYAEDPNSAVKNLPYELVMGDGPDPQLAPMHAESVQLAQILNRLAQNPSSGSASGRLTVTVGANSAIATSDQLLDALVAEGEAVTVDDDRFFANFGHLHDRGQDVLMPFWINTQIVIPGENRPLIVPVGHAEYELHVRGPKLNADVSFYFGIDGKAEFRTMDSLNQAWVLGRKAHVYSGDPAKTAIRMLSQALRVYLAAHDAHPTLAFGGYYKLGVCQDPSAAVEQHLEGKTTLFPLTHDPAMFREVSKVFKDPENQEFLQEFEKLPSDRGSRLPDIHRVLGDLPTTDIATIQIPELRSDLSKVMNNGGIVAGLRRSHGLLDRMRIGLYLVAILLLATFGMWLVRRKKKRG